MTLRHHFIRTELLVQAVFDQTHTVGAPFDWYRLQTYQWIVSIYLGALVAYLNDNEVKQGRCQIDHRQNIAHDFYSSLRVGTRQIDGSHRIKARSSKETT
jgi:hypothetical protein